MKLLIVTFLAFFAIASAAPTENDGPLKITGNNVGNIVNVDVDGQIHINNEVNVLLMSMIFDFIDQQGGIAVAPPGPADETSSIISESSNIDPKALEYLSNYLNL